MKPKYRDLSWKDIERSLKRFTTAASEVLLEHTLDRRKGGETT